MTDDEWIASMYFEQSGFLRQYAAVVRQLMQRDREIEILVEKNVNRQQAEGVVTPTKTQIADQNGISLATVQNVHRVMKETRRHLEEVAA